jgi:AcrR family transcriptional regulator
MPPIFSFEKREEIQAKLLMIGICMIKEKGIKKMTIDDVAERAEIGKGTFYHFFKSKERFVHDVIQFSKEKIYDYINNAVEEKGGLDKETFFNLLHTFSFTSGNNIISFMTKEDEEWLRKKLPEEYALNPEREDIIADLILGQIIGAKQNLNFHVIANMIKIMAMASENKKELHQDALNENLNIMMNMLCDYIYEK